MGPVHKRMVGRRVCGALEGSSETQARRRRSPARTPDLRTLSGSLTSLSSSSHQSPWRLQTISPSVHSFPLPHRPGPSPRPSSPPPLCGLCAGLWVLSAAVLRALQACTYRLLVASPPQRCPAALPAPTPSLLSTPRAEETGSHVQTFVLSPPDHLFLEDSGT